MSQADADGRPRRRAPDDHGDLADGGGCHRGRGGQRPRAISVDLFGGQSIP